MFPTQEQLSQMPLNKLRSLDIRTVEEEKLVQEAVNKKLVSEPYTEQVKLRVPDIKTVEEEKYWQSKIDEAKEDLREKPTEVPFPEVEEPKEEVLGEVPEEVKLGVKRFCLHCDSKGARHKKDCTRPT